MFAKLLKTCVGVGAAICITSAAQAGVIIEDNFDSYAGSGVGSRPESQTNWDGGPLWDPKDGTVDLVADNDWGIDCAGDAGKCVDLDGSSRNAARFRTQNKIQFEAGEWYQLEFDLSGSQRGNSAETARIRVNPGVVDFEVILNSNDPWTHYVVDFVGTGQNKRFFFENVTNAGDNIGIMLDNVKLSVTEPSALGLLGLSLVGVGVMARRRRNA